FSPDGRWLIAATEKSITTWRIDAWSDVHRIDYGGTVIAVSPDSTKLAIGNGEGTVTEYTVQGDALWQKQAHESSITALAFGPDGTRLVTGSLDRTARLLDAATGDPIAQPMRSSGPTLAAMFSPDGRMVATTSTDGEVEIFDGKSGRI